MDNSVEEHVVNEMDMTFEEGNMDNWNDVEIESSFVEENIETFEHENVKERVKEPEIGLVFYTIDELEKYYRSYGKGMRYLIATYYKVVVIHLSNVQCVTLLPLMLPSELHDLKLPEIAIGFVKTGNKGHFVQVNLSSDLIPIPPISTEWHKHKDITAQHLYLRYQEREEQFKQILLSVDAVGATEIMEDLDIVNCG